VFFREGDPAEMAFERPFDAVIGRYVLMFQRDPTAMLRKLAVHVTPRRRGRLPRNGLGWCPVVSAGADV
jgi:hypothetical protein